MKKALLVITVLAVSWVSGASAGGQAVTPSLWKGTGHGVQPNPFLSRGVTPNPWKSFDVRQAVTPNPWKTI